MTDINHNQPTDARDVIQGLAQAFGKLPQVLAVVLGVRMRQQIMTMRPTTIFTCTRCGKCRSIFDGHFWGRARKGPRVTGDGYYEAVVSDTEGNLVEITA